MEHKNISLDPLQFLEPFALSLGHCCLSVIAISQIR
jgi:hypothetical protein